MGIVAFELSGVNYGIGLPMCGLGFSGCARMGRRGFFSFSFFGG